MTDPTSRYVSQRPPTTDPWVQMSNMRPLYWVELPGERFEQVPAAVAVHLARFMFGGNTIPGVVRVLRSFNTPLGDLYPDDVETLTREAGP